MWFHFTVLPFILCFISFWPLGLTYFISSIPLYLFPFPPSFYVFCFGPLSLSHWSPSQLWKTAVSSWWISLTTSCGCRCPTCRSLMKDATSASCTLILLRKPTPTSLFWVGSPSHTYHMPSHVQPLFFRLTVATLPLLDLTDQAVVSAAGLLQLCQTLMLWRKRTLVELDYTHRRPGGGLTAFRRGWKRLLKLSVWLLRQNLD